MLLLILVVRTKFIRPPADSHFIITMTLYGSRITRGSVKAMYRRVELMRLVTGGQTSLDCAALNVTIEMCMPCGVRGLMTWSPWG